MYAGHAAIALALNARTRKVPIVPLALACYGPDWIDAALMIPHPREAMAAYSHSLPAVAIGAVLASALYAAIAKRPGAMLVLAAWLSHWPADYITGLKPLLGRTPLVGLDLYHLPWADPVLECTLIAVGCFLYARSLDQAQRRPRVLLAMGAALMVLQLGADAASSRLDGMPWKPAPLGDR